MEQDGTNGTNYKDKDNEKDNDKDKENYIDSSSCCLPTSGRKQQQQPTYKEIVEECRKKGYTFDSMQFYAYYEANGWLLKEGKPMRNWRAALYAWQKNAMKESATAPKTSAEVHDVTNQHLNKYNPSPNAISWDEFEKLNKS